MRLIIDIDFLKSADQAIELIAELENLVKKIANATIAGLPVVGIMELDKTIKKFKYL